jgi:hypothetical protein
MHEKVFSVFMQSPLYTMFKNGTEMESQSVRYARTSSEFSHINLRWSPHTWRRPTRRAHIAAKLTHRNVKVNGIIGNRSMIPKEYS